MCFKGVCVCVICVINCELLGHLVCGGTQEGNMSLIMGYAMLIVWYIRWDISIGLLLPLSLTCGPLLGASWIVLDIDGDSVLL